MRQLFVGNNGRHDGAELGVESARTVGNVEMSAARCLGISDVQSRCCNRIAHPVA